MSGSNRGDRGAVVVIGLTIAAIVIIFVFDRLGYPANQIVHGTPQPNGSQNNAQNDTIQTVYWGLLTIRDSLAQWIAALAAIGSVAVSVWAVKLVRASLRETRRGAHAAITANRNTLRAIKQEQDNAQRQLRAYVGFEKTTVDKIDFAKPTKFILSIKNFGQTPAYDIKYSLQIEITRIEGFAEIPKQPPEFHDLIGVFDPGHILTVSPVYYLNLSAEDFGGDLAAKFKVFIYFELSFVDAFQVKRTCEMNMYWMPMKLSDLEMNYSSAKAN